MITPMQKKKIFVLAREAGITNEVLHDIAHGLTGKDSLRLLTSREAAVLIDRLCGKRVRTMNPASGAQLRLIRVLERKMGWNTEPERLKAFLYAKTGINDIYALTMPMASRIIEIMKSMIEGKRTERKNGN